jgi:phage baseplate assembly protein W
MAEEFIGKGWSYPLATDPAGSIALSAGDVDLERAMRLILATAPGERPMRPEFGCGIHNYVFENADASTAGRLAFEVKTALTRWEPRAVIEDVSVKVDSRKRNTLYIDIRYVKKGSYDPRNLVFPFYIIPDREE